MNRGSIVRRILIVLLLAVAFGAVLRAQSPAAGVGAVTGHVYCSDTRTPCRFATVSLQPIQALANARAVGIERLTASDWKKVRAKSYSAVTDIDGRFEITGVADGEYYVYAESAGYLDPYRLATTGALGDASQSLDALEKLLPRIRVAAGAETTAELTLVRGGSIEGSVRFDDGGYAYWASIDLYRKDSVGKWKRYEDQYLFDQRMTTPHYADDRGRFFIEGLVPGTYTIKATLPEPRVIEGLGVVLESGGADSLAVFNGDKFRLKDASPIELQEGEDRSDIDIEIPTNGLYTLVGAVNALPDGRTITKGTVSLLDPDDQSPIRQTDIRPDGSFRFRLVVPGNYLVRVAALGGDSNPKSSIQYGILTSPLEVAGDLSGLTYTVSPAK
ncbi:MAG: collagen binding domain-containing protein [Acidobacteriota bacterium]